MVWYTVAVLQSIIRLQNGLVMSVMLPFLYRKFIPSAVQSEPLNLPLNDFLYTVGQLKFRGTSVLFRAPRSFLTGCVSLPDFLSKCLSMPLRGCQLH